MTKTLKVAIVAGLSFLVMAMVAPIISSAADICPENGSCGAGNNAPTTTSDSCPSGQAQSKDTNTCQPLKKASDCSVGVDPQDSTKCSPLGNGCNGNSAETCLKNDPIVKDINTVVDVLSAAVGVVVIGVIILGGIQYSMAGDNASATGAAKQRITNGLIALAAFLFMFAFLQWLIPGGI